MENQRQMSPRTETPPKLTTNFSLSYISICGSSPVSVDELSPKKSPSSSKALLVGSNARPLSESKKFKHPSSSSSKSYISRNNSPVPLSFAPVAPPNRYSEEQAIPRWKTSIPPVMNRSQSSDEPLRSPRRLDTLGPHRSSTNSHNTQATQSVSGLSSNFAQAVASMRQQSPNTQTETETMTAEKEKEKSVSINAQERKEKSKSDDEVQDLRKHFKKSSSHATLEGAKQIHKFAANEEPLPNLVSPETLCSASIIGIEERCEIFGGENSATAAMFMAYVFCTKWRSSMGCLQKIFPICRHQKSCQKSICIGSSILSKM
eukprot:TRINITY_DN2499_c0_g1_i1.p1 TRINITY_DN2499_c0_g1~~TRINITY_DN2499_c0_g1_i1.p1  ORF type:complete len:318 (-),score=57.09 TRINITY_DN2499_c0_g1_i1:395-1348(-)